MSEIPTRAFHAKLGLNGRRKDVMVRSSYVSPLWITGYLIRSINRIHGNHKSIDKRFDTEKGGSLITSSIRLSSLVVFCFPTHHPLKQLSPKRESWLVFLYLCHAGQPRTTPKKEQSKRSH